MSNEIVLGAVPDRLRYAQALAESDLLPQAYRRKPANVLLAVEYGAALGLSPMTAIQGINVIQGKPTLSADLMAALIRRAGHKLRVKMIGTEASPVATATLIRADDPDYEFTCQWDMARARKAGLLDKGNWQKFPAAMLKARAISEIAREGASEVLHGAIYTPEELGAEVDVDGDVVVVSDVQESADAADEPVDADVVEDQPNVRPVETVHLPDPLLTEKKAVKAAWELHRGAWDAKAASGVFAAWTGGEDITQATGERLLEYAAWLESDSESVDEKGWS